MVQKLGIRHVKGLLLHGPPGELKISCEYADTNMQPTLRKTVSRPY
jgi:ATP-dependent 26S proteasome regulatory subunit